MDCQSHNIPFALVCDECDVRVCLDCATYDHKGHKFSKFDDAEPKIRRKLERIVKINEDELSSLEKCMTLINVAQQAEKETKSIIENRHDQLLEELLRRVGNAARKMIDVCDNDKQKRLDLLNDQETSINVMLTTKKEYIYRLQLILKSTKKDVVIRAGLKYKLDEKRKPLDPPNVQPLTFTPGQTNDTEVEGMFGQVNHSTPGNAKVHGTSVPTESLASSMFSVDENSSDFDEITRTTSTLEAQADDYDEWNGKSFQASQTAITSICPDSSGHAWMKCDKKLQKKDAKGNTIENKVFTKEITGMVLDESGDNIWVSNRHNQKLEYIWLPDLSTIKAFRCSLMPLHICWAADGNIFVTMVDSRETNPTFLNVRMLVKLNEEGDEKNRVAYDDLGDGLFVIPERVRANRSGTMVAVTNRTNDPNSPAKQGAALAMGGHLVVLDGNLNLKYRYLGNGVVIPAMNKYSPSTSDTKFVPNDVDFDNKDNIILVDGYTKSVQIRKAEDCSLIRLLLSDTAIPLCVGYSRSDETFWVGFKSGKVTIIKVIK